MTPLTSLAQALAEIETAALAVSRSREWIRLGMTASALSRALDTELGQIQAILWGINDQLSIVRRAAGQQRLPGM